MVRFFSFSLLIDTFTCSCIVTVFIYLKRAEMLLRA
jgi:hypothetical protein